MTHRRAILLMLLITLMWSIAGVVTRHLESARGFEVTFWRSLFTALSLLVYFVWQHGRATLTQFKGGKVLWLSGLMWACMFTCFMMALSMTTVANVLITMSLAPLMAALLARFMLGLQVPQRTWVAILVAGAAIAWMYSSGLSGDPRHLAGSLVALGVPLAAAINWNLIRRTATSVDLLPALLIGAVLSSLVTGPLSWPWHSSPHDLGLLALLGLFQLAIPCILAVRVARHLPAPEMALLALLEIVFGIALVWWGAGEEPSHQVLVGGAVVLTTLAVNEWLGMRSRRLNGS
ncbi:MAG: DMT family transporter [Burkholderiales bacterium]